MASDEKMRSLNDQRWRDGNQAPTLVARLGQLGRGRLAEAAWQTPALGA